jgi:hypothetical protein
MAVVALTLTFLSSKDDYSPYPERHIQNDISDLDLLLRDFIR